MAGKGYRPALFELVRKGPLKPNQKGTLTTPKWFYNRKNGSVVEPVRRETEPRVIDSSDDQAESAARPRPEPAERPESIIGLQLSDKRLAFWAPYWAVGLVFMGFFLCFLVTFWLGQISVRGSESPPDQQNIGAASLEDIREDPVQRGVLDLAARTEEGAGTPGVGKAENQAANLTAAPEAKEASQQNSAAVPGRNCLVLCSHSNQRELRSVQEYFSTKGVLTKIGRFSRSYIVYCEEGADRPSSSEAVILRNRMIDIGRRYNSEKPRGAASFLPSTFESAYWVERDRITIIEQ